MIARYDLKSIQNKSTLLQFSQQVAGYFDKQTWIKIFYTFLATLLTSSISVLLPYLTTLAIDKYIAVNNLGGLQNILLIMLGLTIFTAVISFVQTNITARISQRILHTLRGQLFNKIQELPLEFFNQNKGGDVISRVNGDTEKLNDFFGRGLFQFVSNFFIFIGIGVFVFFVSWQLAIIMWLPIIALVIFNQSISPASRKANLNNLQSRGEMSGFIEENTSNFRAIAVFNKRQYFRDQFNIFNQNAFKSRVKSQIFNGIFAPIYSLAGFIAQLGVLIYGLALVNDGRLSIAVLIGFIFYSQKFYEPLNILGGIWGSLQEALTAWDRVQSLLKLN
jgi:ATP-binding cassette, subfamily B, bacterial